MERKIIPIETYETRITDENCISIFDKNYEIAFRELKDDQMADIIKNVCRLSDYKLKQFRVPKLFFCKILLDNSGFVPLEITDIKIHYNKTSLKALSGDVINKYNKYLYEINFNEIQELFKIATDDICEYDFDSGKDLVKYNSNQIQPGEKVMRILFFNRIPANIRKFTLSIVIKSDITQKIIDFKLMKFEYRKFGKHFVTLKKDDID